MNLATYNIHVSSTGQWEWQWQSHVSFLKTGEWQGEYLIPHITQQPQAEFITTCHLLYTLSLSQSPNGAIETIPMLITARLAQEWKKIWKSFPFLEGNWKYWPFSGPQSWWRSFHQQHHALPSCRKPCNWWWEGGKQSGGVPSSPSMLSGSAAGSSCSQVHYCTLKGKEFHKVAAQT